MPSYTRIVELRRQVFSRGNSSRAQGSYPARGEDMPIKGQQRRLSLSLGEFAWNLEQDVETPAVSDAEARQLDIWLTPQGFLKAATTANAKGLAMTVGGKKVTIVSFTFMNKYHINGTISEDNLVERVQTWIPNPVMGDMLYEHEYADYKDFNGVKFPTTIRSFQGDRRLSAGHSWREIKVTTVEPNSPANAPSAAPSPVRQAFAPGIMTENQRRQTLIHPVGDKVWLISGGTHSSAVIEFKDYLAIVEAPVNEERSLWVIPAEIRRLSPKPIKYVINTHHHFDHAGGLRTYVAQGASVITHESNRQFFEQVLLSPFARTLQPDLLSSLYPAFNEDRVPKVETVGNTKYVLTDGSRTVEIYSVQGLAHSGDMLIVYLPAEKILINAELFSPRAADEPPVASDASMKTLQDNIQRLNSDCGHACSDTRCSGFE